MEDVKVCRICLAMNVKMYDFHSTSLETYYDIVVGNNIRSTGLPKFTCFECSELLKKYYFFRKRCLRGQAVLSGLMHTCGKVYTEQIKQIDKKTFQLSSDLALSKLLCIDVTFSNNDNNDDPVKEESFRPSNTKINEKEILCNETENNDSIVKREPFECVDDVEFVDKESIKREDSLEDLTVQPSYVNVLSSDDDDEPLSVHKKRKNKDKKRKKKDSFEMRFEDDDDDDEDIQALSNIDSFTHTEESGHEFKRKRGRPRKDAPPYKKPRKRPTRRTVNTGGVAGEIRDVENYCTVIKLTEEEQLEEVTKRQTSSNYLNAVYQCNLCFKGFINAKAWKHHTSKHEPSAGDVECPICKLRFKSKRLLQKHNTNHRMKYACKACPYVSKSITQAQQHQGWHKGVTYKCQYCDDISTKWTSYLSHVRIKHPSEFVCDVCGYSFVSKLGLSMHRSMMHKDAEAEGSKENAPHCELCDVKFLSEEAYRRHMVTSVKHTGSTSFNNGCRVCGESFPDAEALRLHHRRQHAAPRPRNYGRKPTAHAWPAPCEHCPEEIPNAREYWKHFRRMHPDKNYPIQKNYVCDICGKSFRGNAFLVYHKRTHFEERAYKCQLCPKAFHNRYNLHMHEKTHSDTRPYPCSVCSKAFKSKGALDRHFRSHTGVKPYSCEVCGKAFAQSNSRKLHVRTVHLKQPSPYISRSRLERRNKQFLY